jgi:hypothetical protein
MPSMASRQHTGQPVCGPSTCASSWRVYNRARKGKSKSHDAATSSTRVMSRPSSHPIAVLQRLPRRDAPPFCSSARIAALRMSNIVKPNLHTPR